MAIDDNTSYELTGYQVKDLAGRIRRKADASSVPTSISDLGQVTSSDVDWSTMPGYMHLVAIGKNTGVNFATSSFIGLGCSKASGQSEIIDSAYAAFSPSVEDIILQPGRYYITASIRFGDATTNNNVFGGLTIKNSGTTYDDDDIRIGNWGFTNQRICIEVNRYFNFTNTNGTSVRFRVWAQSSGSVSRALMYIFRIGD